MARIRTVKPEFWTDGAVIDLSFPARLLFIGCWNFTLCDRGHLPDDPRRLKMQVLPADDVDADALVAELVDSGRLDRIEAGGRSWLHVRRFADHQKVDPRHHPRCPVCQSTPNHTETHPNTPEPTRSHRNPPKEGKGREGIKTPSSTDVNDAHFDAWWQQYPRKVGKGQARKAYRTASKKADHATLLAAIQAQKPQLVARGVEFCPHGSTWLNGERWLDQPDRTLIEERLPWE